MVSQRTLSTSKVVQSADLEVVSKNKVFGGSVTRYRHASETVKCDMGFAVYTPAAAATKKVPTLYWLSGLTCDDTNFIFKAGAFEHLANHGFQIVCPDTSPRGLGIEGEDDSYDFGSGAGFYISATTPLYKNNYQMFSYITEELPSVVEKNTPADPDKKSIFGHSMGGLGALNCFLKTNGVYQSVSAFSPICNPVNCPWGHKGFTGYIGEDKQKWKDWDPSIQLHNLGSDAPPVLISQGTDDQFLDEQLLTHSLPQMPQIDVRMEEGYDHSYYFISTFIKDHIDFHAKYLK